MSQIISSELCFVLFSLQLLNDYQMLHVIRCEERYSDLQLLQKIRLQDGRHGSFIS